MKKLLLAALALFVMAVSVSAQKAAAVAPAVKFGSLTSAGQMASAELKQVKQLDLVDAAGQSVVGFELQIIRPDGKLYSRAPISGNQIPAEMQTIIGREKTGSRLVIMDVRVKDEKTGITKAVDGFTVEIL